MTTQRIARIAIFAAVLFLQEQLLTFLPNVQLTQLLIVLYFYLFGFLDTAAIIVIHVLLDNLTMGSWSLFYTPTMLIGWLLLPLLLLWLAPHSKNSLWIGIITFLHGFVYSWLFLGASVLLWEMEPWTYFMADIQFELILALNGFVTVWFLFPPLRMALQKVQRTRQFPLI